MPSPGYEHFMDPNERALHDFSRDLYAGKSAYLIGTLTSDGFVLRNGIDEED